MSSSSSSSETHKKLSKRTFQIQILCHSVRNIFIIKKTYKAVENVHNQGKLMNESGEHNGIFYKAGEWLRIGSRNDQKWEQVEKIWQKMRKVETECETKQIGSRNDQEMRNKLRKNGKRRETMKNIERRWEKIEIGSRNERIVKSGG